MIIDAGGGTIDLSTYKFTSVNPMSAEEIAPPDCKSSTTTAFLHNRYIPLLRYPSRVYSG